MIPNENFTFFNKNCYFIAEVRKLNISIVRDLCGLVLITMACMTQNFHRY